MKRIKVASFDVEGTLIDHRFSDLVWERGVPEWYARKEGINFQRAKEYVKGEYDRVGEEKIEWYDIGYWFQRFGLSADWKRLLRDYEHEIAVYPEVPSVLETLNKRHSLIIISNSVREFIDLQLKKIRNHFTHIFSATSDFKQVKKTTEVYSKICSILEIKPDEMVHVGDHWNFDFIAPRKLGITAFYLDRTGSQKGKFVVKDLKEFEKICLSSG